MIVVNPVLLLAVTIFAVNLLHVDCGILYCYDNATVLLVLLAISQYCTCFQASSQSKERL